MELTLEIISFQKSLMGDAQSQTFDETGGSIGRGRDSTWVLPDPNRYVSTRHAEISFSGGRFQITDTSTNGVFVNGSATAIGRDQRVPLSDGDRLVLGDYEIAVRQEAGSRRPEAPLPVKAAPTAFARSGEAPPKDILDVIDRRRTEPRLGRLEIPADAFDDPAPPPVAPPAAAPRLSAAPPPAPRGPIPPPPPRRQAPPARTEPADRKEPTIAPATAASIPDGIDFGPAAATPAPTTTPEPAAPRTILPDDLDALLPDPPATRPTPTAPPGIVPQPASAAPPVGANRPLLPDDDLDDLLPAAKPETPVTPEQRRSEVVAAPPPLPAPKPSGQRPAEDAPPPEAPKPETSPSERLLPEGVPLLRPMPGTGNRPQPLSQAEPVERAAPLPQSAPPPIAAQRDTAPAVATEVRSGEMVSALAAGLGVDPRSLDGLDAAATVTLVGSAARSAALGIAGALDARNALARTAGLDPSAFDPDDDNPFLVFRSGEAALKQSLSSTAPSQALDAATRQSVATLSANASAAAVALQSLLDRFETTNPPQSADEVREIFGTSFLNAYHREISRLR